RGKQCDVRREQDTGHNQRVVNVFNGERPQFRFTVPGQIQKERTPVQLGFKKAIVSVNDGDNVHLAIPMTLSYRVDDISVCGVAPEPDWPAALPTPVLLETLPAFVLVAPALPLAVPAALVSGTSVVRF